MLTMYFKSTKYCILLVYSSFFLPCAIFADAVSQDEKLANIVVAAAKDGQIIGKVTPQAAIFFGIPFSQPPTGEFRWRKPRNPLKYQTLYWNATYKRPGCIQKCNQPAPKYTCPQKVSEDCLYLNVFVPARLLDTEKANSIIRSPHYVLSQHPTQSLAVMVWFHGGNFRYGSGSSILYDGRFMADKGNVIVITTNYRLGSFGYLVQGKNGTEESKGNFGVWDQLKALEWVRRNIKYFGGDRQKVTIFGQSAGAESVAIHMTSKRSDHLFQKSIMQSNPFGLPLRKIEDARKYGNFFAKAAGCAVNDMSCLRSRSPALLLRAEHTIRIKVTNLNLLTTLFQQWVPVIDGDLVSGQPIALFMQGKEQKKPMLMGSTVDEGALFVTSAFHTPMNRFMYEVLLRVWLKKDSAKVKKQYHGKCLAKSCDYRTLLSQIAADYIFVCPQRKAEKSAVKIQRWWYIFNQTWSFYKIWKKPFCFHRVCHGAEVAYLFNIQNLTSITFTNEERILSERLLWYWTNFAKYGDPNVSDKLSKSVTEFHSTNESENKLDPIKWFAFNETAKSGGYTAIQFTAHGDHIMQQPYKNVCNFWDNVNEYAEH